MRLTVKLYGTLRRSLDGYNHSSGLEVVIPKEEASIHDLLLHLNLVSERLGMIYMDGQPLDKNSQIANGAMIKIFQPISGG